MNPQLLQTASYMAGQARLVRFRPVPELPTAEVYTQMERLLTNLWSFAHCVGVNLGRHPTIISTGASITFTPVTLARLTELEVEVLATYHMLGMGSAMVRGIMEVTRTPPTKLTNFKVIVDETWPEDILEDDEEVQPLHTD